MILNAAAGSFPNRPGQSLPSIEVAAKIADVLEVSLDYLAGNSKKAAVEKKQ